MPLPSLRNRDQLSGPVLDELENLVATLKGLWLVEHNEDGSHQTRDRLLDFVPVGSIQMWPTATAPSAWLLCRGQQVSRSTYNGLFQLIGTTYGVGDGSTTFNLPDLQQRFPLGKAAAGTGSVLGSTGGNIDLSSLLSITGSTASTGAHTHTGPSHSHGGSTGAAGTHTHAASTYGGGTSGLVVDQNLDAISVRVSVTDGSGGDGITAAAGSHSHSISADGTGSTSSDGNHSHAAGTLAVTSAGAMTTAYIALNYIIFTGVA